MSSESVAAENQDKSLKAVDDAPAGARKHNVRCEYARRPKCRCSCRGSKHGTKTAEAVKAKWVRALEREFPNRRLRRVEDMLLHSSDRRMMSGWHLI
jgi:hypothetical protein